MPPTVTPTSTSAMPSIDVTQGASAAQTDVAALTSSDTSILPQATADQNGLAATDLTVGVIVPVETPIGALPPEVMGMLQEMDTTPAANIPQATDAAVPEPIAATATPPAAPAASPAPVISPVSPTMYSNLLDVLTSEFNFDHSLADKMMIDHISTGADIEQLLVKDNLVPQATLTKAKAILNHVPFVSLAEIAVVPEALNRVPEGVARAYKMLPFSYNKDDGTLWVAMANPLDLSAIDFVQQKVGLRLVVHYAVPDDLERLLAEYYSETISGEVTLALEQTDVARNKGKKQDFSDLSKETIRQAPISKIVETIITYAIRARASDIHIEPLEEHTRVRYRIDGILMEKLILPRSVHEAVISRVKILSGLKIDEKRSPQDGRYNFTADEQEVDLRVSTLPTIHGEKVVMRLLKKDQKVATLPDLGLNGLALTWVQEAIKVPHGIILITGPTGSGKTTTLYSLLHTINTPKVNIMTLEDPVEYQMTGVNQVQINPQAGLTFASGLRSFLRQDPNIIMVGEIRDSETAELAIQAALTGHLVFSTLHTSSSAGALPRLMDMGCEPFLLASSMTMVMGQRVMRLLNANYKESYTPDPAVADDIKTVLGDRYEGFCKQFAQDPSNLQLMRPSQNRPQNEPEYFGRIAVYEVMKISEDIATLILERKPASEMEKAALKNGMLLMKQDGYLKVLEGLTTIEEVLRVAQI